MTKSLPKIKNYPGVVRTAGLVEELNDNAKDLAGWLVERAMQNELRWLLAHADDGVIWGRVDNQALLTSGEAILKFHSTMQAGAPEFSEIKAAIQTCVALRSETLQQVRLFSEAGELLLWRDSDNKFRARVITEPKDGEKPEWDQCYDERQLLWGSHGTPLPYGFTLLRDGSQGLRHAVPLKLSIDNDGSTRPPRLIVRHYISKAGFARVEVSRLVNLEEEEGQ